VEALPAGAEGVRDGRFHEIGIGACAGDYSDSKTTMYTTDFAAPRRTEVRIGPIIKNL
jgi:hypothetical protein